MLAAFLLNPVRGWANEPVDTSAALHVLAGASGALLVSAVSYPLVDSGSHRRNAIVVAGLGAGGALILGLTKELLDLSGWGQPEWSNLLLTVGGGLLAGSMVYALTALHPSGEEGDLGISAVYGAFALVLSLPVGEGLYRRTIPSLRSRS
jgi:zinc transporter ZupT